MPADADLTRVATALTRATRVTALTGAGVSVASGIPTFRGPGGLWKTHRAAALATADAFARDPRLVWEWYDWRRGVIAKAQPNTAHDVLARWSHAWPGFTLVTQNVDGLHERADTSRLIRLHGSIWRLRCWTPCDAGRDEWDDLRSPLGNLPPACPHCGALARPAVVWFGETLDPAHIAAAIDATACDVFLTIGTSAVVHPAAGLVHHARRRAALTVEINPDTTDASGAVDVALRGTAEEMLVALEEARTWIDARSS